MKTVINDLRTFIKRLEEEGELARVKVEVDWKYELGAIAGAVYGPPPGPALLFEKVKDYDIPVLTGGLHTVRGVATVLGLDPQIDQVSLVKEYIRRIETPVEPILVKDGPCKENKHFDNIDVLRFPVPWWDEKAGGRFIGTWNQVVTKDPENNWRNVGPYRMMVLERDICTVHFAPSTHMGLIYTKYEEMNRPMPVAVSIGTDPTCMLAAAAPFPVGIDEWCIASALRGKPLELIKCETVDLEVPAHAEIILEGEVPPLEMRAAGPWGDHTGYFAGGVKQAHIMKVRCITHRNDPIFRGSAYKEPIDEERMLTSVTYAAEAHMMYKRSGFPGVCQVNFPVKTDPNFLAIISITKTYGSQGLDAGRLLLSNRLGRYLKHVVVVDDDIDVFDLERVFWAINVRVQAGRDIYISRNETGSKLDPSISAEFSGFTDKMIIDATWPTTPDIKPRDEWDGKKRPPKIGPSDQLRQLLKKRWKEYGLNQFGITIE